MAQLSVISDTVWNENGDCDGMGVNPIIIIKHVPADKPKIEQIANEFCKRRDLFTRLRNIQQGNMPYYGRGEENENKKDYETDLAEKCAARGMVFLPENEERLAVWAMTYFVKRAFAMGIGNDIDVFGIDNVVLV